jgi:HEAT repeat protein
MTTKCAFAAMLLSTVLCARAESTPVTESPAPDAKPTEDTIRKRFLVSYQTAKNPSAKANVVAMLQGLTEKESRRLLAGMLGDHDEDVRIAACRAMAQTPDPDGYFVKPLMGALTDSSEFVRIAAADALGSAKIKADATKALVYSLMVAVGALNENADENKRAAQVIGAYNDALERLSSRHAKEKDPRAISSFWMDYWKQNEDALRAKDQELKGPDEPPTRPQGLEPDSFDKPEKKPEGKNDKK